ncbi:hypothetical protein SLS62_009439 [Diatrype stigma]|uniref:Uncharacterized protein n=1 Tax=Diatrype stigma TaxID=117547 RepID=A0AAN9YIG4_9PEZI
MDHHVTEDPEAMRCLQETVTSPDTRLRNLTIAALCISPPPDDASQRSATTTNTTGPAVPAAAAAAVAAVGSSDLRPPRAPDGARKADVCRSRCVRRMFRALGVCTACQYEPATPGYIQCEACRGRNSRYKSGRRQRARTEGLCIGCCFLPKERSGDRVYSLCMRCRNNFNRSLRARRAERARYNNGNGGDLPPRDHPDFAGEEQEEHGVAHHPPGHIAIADLLNRERARSSGPVTLAELLELERAYFPERAHRRERAQHLGGIAIADLLNPTLTDHATEATVIDGRAVDVVVLE